MKAPDKIWANDYGLWWRNKQPVKYTEEYIRKDALLKWAKETLEILETDSGISEDFRSGAALELEEVINHINEM